MSNIKKIKIKSNPFKKLSIIYKSNLYYKIIKPMLINNYLIH